MIDQIAEVVSGNQVIDLKIFAGASTFKEAIGIDANEPHNYIFNKDGKITHLLFDEGNIVVPVERMLSVSHMYNLIKGIEQKWPNDCGLAVAHALHNLSLGQNNPYDPDFIIRDMRLNDTFLHVYPNYSATDFPIKVTPEGLFNGITGDSLPTDINHTQINLSLDSGGIRPTQLAQIISSMLPSDSVVLTLGTQAWKNYAYDYNGVPSGLTGSDAVDHDLRGRVNLLNEVLMNQELIGGNSAAMNILQVIAHDNTHFILTPAISEVIANDGRVVVGADFFFDPMGRININGKDYTLITIELLRLHKLERFIGQTSGGEPVILLGDFLAEFTLSNKLYDNGTNYSRTFDAYNSRASGYVGVLSAVTIGLPDNSTQVSFRSENVPSGYTGWNGNIFYSSGRPTLVLP